MHISPRTILSSTVFPSIYTIPPSLLSSIPTPTGSTPPISPSIAQKHTLDKAKYTHKDTQKLDAKTEEYQNGDRSTDNGIDLYALPEGCIANALSFTSPRDACRLSLVGSTFRSAAQSDDVWERFLPADYRDNLSRSDEGINLLRSASLSKKQLFLHLCDHPVLIDGGTKSFSLEKCSGKKCYMLAARDLTIVWSDTPKYWKWTSLSMSRFTEVAELLSVFWLEIRGKINTSMLSLDTTYAAYLVFRLTSSYGLDSQPGEAEVGISGEEGKKQVVHLDPEGAQRLRQLRVPRSQRDQYGYQRAARRRLQQNMPADGVVQYAKQRGDGWMEIELGEIFIKGDENVDMEMNLMEVKGGHPKSGLVVEGIEVRPKEGTDQIVNT
ncbi:hypothetical protein ACH5RR_018727 [Cinchona calisaya]|uniref:F-box domain-containing protein n=1 Tax=Cinchona calisaya TaxID=153742 RepID=A0ABD2ZSF7_9GENT